MKRWLMILLLSLTGALAQPPPTATPAAIQQEIKGLRSLPDDKRADVTYRLALQIRSLTGPKDRLPLAMGLSNLATEGDFGRLTLQEVATTLVEAIRDAHPQTSEA